MVRAVALACMMFFAAVQVAAGELVGELDRSTIQAHETVALTLAYSGEEQLDLDLAPLEQQFDIVGRSRSHHTQIINGEIRVRQILTLQLAPLESGEMEVPALQFRGSSTEAMRLTVVDGEAIDPADRTHFMEVEVSTRSPWVQQQVIYNVRIFQRTPVIDGSLTEPTGEGVTLERLGSDRSYREEREGNTWDVHERRYAVFPQRSGKVSLDPVRLLARVSADGNSSSFFNRRTRQIRLRGDRIDLDVQAAPVEMEWWLPATALNLSANWLDADGARVGDPLTLEIVLTAHGAQTSQLPELPVPEGVAAKVYTGRSETGKQALASGLVGQRRVRHQLVPTQEGSLRLPPLEVSWWSTSDGQARTESVMVPPVEVSPAVSGSSSESPATPLPEPTPTAEPEPTEPAVTDREPPVATLPDATRPSWWMAVQEAASASRAVVLKSVLFGALALFALVLIRFGLWPLWSRVRGSRRATLQRAARAMRRGETALSQQHLMAWAALVWPEDRPRNLQTLSQRVAEYDPAMAQQIGMLDQALYHADRELPDASSWVRALGKVARQVRADAHANPVGLVLPTLGAAWKHDGRHAD